MDSLRVSYAFVFKVLPYPRNGLFPAASHAAGDGSRVSLCSPASEDPEQAFLTHWNLPPSSLSAGFQTWEEGAVTHPAPGMTKE